MGGGAVELAEVTHGYGGAERPAAARVVRGLRAGSGRTCEPPFLSLEFFF